VEAAEALLRLQICANPLSAGSARSQVHSKTGRECVAPHPAVELSRPVQYEFSRAEPCLTERALHWAERVRSFR
jgi:hypothetical protein